MDNQSKTPAKAWVMLVIVYLVSASASMLWFSCPPLANNIIESMIITDDVLIQDVSANFGWLMNWVAVGAIISALIAIFLQNKLGPKIIMLLAAAFVAAGCVVSALCGTSYQMLCIGRVLGGLGVGFVAVSATTAASCWFGDDRRGTAIAIWATWVPVSVLITYNITVPLCVNASDNTDPCFHNVWWVIAVIAIIAFLLALFVYKKPENGQISSEPVKLSEGLPYVLKRAPIFLCLAFFCYTFVSHGFTTYNTTFFTTAVEEGGLGWDSTFANNMASIATASGIIAPLFGIIYDKIKFENKNIMIMIGGLGYVVACLLGFKLLDWLGFINVAGNEMPVMFIIYLIFMIIANATMVATLRSTMPMLTGKGGVTAVTLGLALITVLEFGGQLFTSVYGSVIDSVGFSSASLMVGVPVAVLLAICGFLTKAVPFGKKQQ